MDVFKHPTYYKEYWRSAKREQEFEASERAQGRQGVRASEPASREGHEQEVRRASKKLI